MNKTYILITGLTFIPALMQAMESSDTIAVKDSVRQTRELKELTVTGKYLKQKADGYVISMQNNPIAKGRTLAETFNFMPGVMFLNDALTIQSRGGTLVYINNRKVNGVDELKALQAEQIDKVEVKFNTGSAYDARNSGGVIYITLKKIRNGGFYGSISASVGLRPKYGWTSDNINMPFSVRLGKLSLYNYISYYDFKNIFTYAYHNTYTATGKTIDRINDERGWYRIPEEVLSAVYDINKNQYIGLYLSYSGSKFTPHTVTTEEGATNFIQRHTKNDQYQGTLDYKLTWGTFNSSVNIKADYLYKKNNYKGRYYTALEDTGNELLDKDIRMFLGEARLNFNLSENTSLYMGTEYSRNRTGSYQWQLSKTNPFMNTDLNCDIHADDYSGYAGYSTIWKKLGIDAGLRLQSDRVYYLAEGYEKQGKTFTDLYPSLNLSLLLNEKKGGRISLNMSRNLLYLPYTELSPVKTFYDAYSYSVGNTELNPWTSYSANLTYMPTSKWSFSAFCSRSFNDIYYITKVEDADKQLVASTPVNMKGGWVYRLFGSGNIQMTKWLNLVSMAYWEYVQKKYMENNESKKMNYNKFFCYLQLNCDLPHSFGGQISFNMETKTKIDDRIFHPVHGLSIQIYKRFLNDKLSIKLNSTPIYSKRRKIEIRKKDYTSLSNLLTSQTNFKLTISYSFSSKRKVNVKTINKIQNYSEWKEQR